MTRFARSTSAAPAAGGRVPPPPPPAEHLPPSEAEAALGVIGRPAAPKVVPRKSTNGIFTVTGDRIEWTCSRCGTVSDIEDGVCPICGASLNDALRPSQSDRPTRDPNNAALLSLFLPGAGHAYVGLWGQAIARAVISVWLAAVVLLMGAQGSGGMALLFGLVAAVLWGITAHDAHREATGKPNAIILKPRYFLFFVLGTMGLVMALLLLQGLSRVSG